MQIVEYKVNKEILTVGFKVDNFIVYSQIAYDENKTKYELIQLAYEQVKQTIDYEKTLEEHSFTTDIEGEEFIPEEPKPKYLEIDFNTLTGTVLDQYRDVYSTDIEFIIESTDKARIEENTIIENIVEEDTEYFVVARYGDLEERQKRIIYAHKPDKLAKLEEQLLEVQSYIVEKEYQELLKEGGI